MAASIAASNTGEGAVSSGDVPWMDARSFSTRGSGAGAAADSMMSKTSERRPLVSLVTEKGMAAFLMISRARSTMEPSTVRLVALIFMVFTQLGRKPHRERRIFLCIIQKK